MATYTITLNERSARGKALIEYLKALGVLMHKVSPKSATKHHLYDPETGEYLNDETMKAIEQAHDDMKHGRLKTYSSADEMFNDTKGSDPFVSLPKLKKSGAFKKDLQVSDTNVPSS